MIDTHSHIIFDVDDGSKTLEQSIKYLEELKEIGLNKVVCTPHVCHYKEEKASKIEENFKILDEEAKKLGIILYLGNEILYTDKALRYLKEKKFNTINNTNYILVEFKRTESTSIDSIINCLEELIDNGYHVILAHPELYIHYRNIEYVKKIKELGVMLQLDAKNLYRFKTSHKTYKFAKKLIKERLIDLVASDSHCTSKRNFRALVDAYKKISKKDINYADIIFKQNPNEVVGEKDEKI